MPFCTNCGSSVKPSDKYCNNCGSPLQSANNQLTPASNEKPPIVLDGFTQPGFPVKVFTVFFMKDRMVFAKTGSWTTSAAGTMSASMGGSAGGRMQGYAIGTLMDHFSGKDREAKASMLAGFDPDMMVSADKANFQTLYSAVSMVEVKGPNFAGEVNVKVKAVREHKFRLDNQSKESLKYVLDVFQEFLPGKTVQK
jgi:hypothetical protein